MAFDRPYRHAQGLRWLGADGAGDAQAQSAQWHLFVFRGRRGGLIKVLWHDGQGMCLFAKRLERGRFVWPSVADGTVAITPAQLGYLLEGIDWRLPQRSWRPEAAG
jgi:transposase